MNLKINQSGNTTVVTMNANGEKVTEIVIDPCNATQPMERNVMVQREMERPGCRDKW